MATTYDRRINLFINGKEVQANMKTITAEFARSRNELAKMEIGSKEYNAQLKKVQNLRGIMDHHNSQLRNTSSLWQKAKGVFSKFAPVAGIAGLTAGFVNLVGKMKNAIDEADNFQERVDNLSALTGLEGQPLKDLADTAKKASVKIIEGNVRIKQSADDIVDAYTKVGSQRPELLKNGAALASVTEDAIILSEAAKSELEPAVTGLTTTMNQFNLGAEHSRRIINAMAAGSKEGAADIPYLTEAIEKSGTTLSLMNVPLEQNIALIEAIAPNYAQASQAGNSLDKVFLKLKEKQIGYVDGTFSVNAALEELAQRYKNGESAASIFGVEHSKMGELLVKSKNEFNRYTKAVTGTNVAIEQASKNTNNAKAIQAQAQNEFKLTAIALGERLSPAMQQFYKIAGTAASVLTRFISIKASDQLREDRIEMNNLFTAIKHTKEGTDERKKAIDQLNTSYGNYLQNLLTEHSTLIEIEKAQRAANSELIRNMQIKLREEDLEALARKQKNIMDNILGDVKRRKGESLMGPAETEIFSLLDEMANMSSIDEAKNKLGAFAKVYRDASKNIGTYSENIQQFFDLLKIRQEQQNLLNSINKLSTPPNEIIPPNGKNGNEPGGLNPNSTTDNESSEALKALELANKQRTFLLQEQYGKEENMQKFLHARLLANELAFLQTKLQLEPDESKSLDIQNQILETQKKYNVALQEAMTPLVLKKEAVDQLNTSLLEEEKLMQRIIDTTAKAQQEQDDLTNKLIEQGKTYTEAITVISDGVADMAAGTEDAFKRFAKNMLLFALEQLKIQTQIAIAGATVQSLTQPDSILTFGITGLVRAAILVGLIEAAFAAVEGLVQGAFYDGGFTGPGGKYQPAGIVHANEYVVPQEGLRNPTLRPIIEMVEAFRQNNTLATVDFSAIQQAIPHRVFSEGGFTSKPTGSSSGTNSSGFNHPETIDNELKHLIRENIQATRQLMQWKPAVAIETIERKRKQYNEMIDNSGL